MKITPTTENNNRFIITSHAFVTHFVARAKEVCEIPPPNTLKGIMLANATLSVETLIQGIEGINTKKTASRFAYEIQKLMMSSLKNLAEMWGELATIELRKTPSTNLDKHLKLSAISYTLKTEAKNISTHLKRLSKPEGPSSQNTIELPLWHPRKRTKETRKIIGRIEALRPDNGNNPDTKAIHANYPKS